MELGVHVAAREIPSPGVKALVVERIMVPPVLAVPDRIGCAPAPVPGHRTQPKTVPRELDPNP